MTIALLLQVTASIAWSASCGTITPGAVTAKGATATYTAPKAASGSCTITASGSAGTPKSTTVRFLAQEVTGRFAFGLSQLPQALYCEVGSPWSGVLQPLSPTELLPALRVARACGWRIIAVPPRRWLTANGQTAGRFVLDSAKALMGRYAKVAPLDTLAAYHQTLLGFNLADDYTCLTCWGGVAITPTQIAAWADVAKTALPGVALGVRVTADWVPLSLAPKIDYVWAQYHTGKGDYRTYFDQAAADAKAKGLKLVMGVNVADCAGGGTPPCTAAQLRTFWGYALQHPAACAGLGWMYDKVTLADTGVQHAYRDLSALAGQRLTQDCGR